MQSRKITMSCFVLLVSATIFRAAQMGRDSPSRTLGYYDSATRIFEPLQETMNSEQPAVVPTTGKLTVKFTNDFGAREWGVDICHDKRDPIATTTRQSLPSPRGASLAMAETAA